MYSGNHKNRKYRGVAVSAPTLQSTLVGGIGLVNIHRRGVGGGAPCESRRGCWSETPKGDQSGRGSCIFLYLSLRTYGGMRMYTGYLTPKRYHSKTDTEIRATVTF